MIGEATKAAIIALVNVDPGATDAERKSVEAVLSGARPMGRTVRIKDAASLMGVTRRTIANWVRAGRLDAVRHPSGKLAGVSEASLARV